MIVHMTSLLVTTLLSHHKHSQQMCYDQCQSILGCRCREQCCFLGVWHESGQHEEDPDTGASCTEAVIQTSPGQCTPSSPHPRQWSHESTCTLPLYQHCRLQCRERCEYIRGQWEEEEDMWPAHSWGPVHHPSHALYSETRVVPHDCILVCMSISLCILTPGLMSVEECLEHHRTVSPGTWTPPPHTLRSIPPPLSRLSPAHTLLTCLCSWCWQCICPRCQLMRREEDREWECLLSPGRLWPGWGERWGSLVSDQQMSLSPAPASTIFPHQLILK